MSKGKNLITFSRLRIFVMLALLGVLIFCTTKYVGIGTLCAYCPVGILQTASASLSVTVAMLVTLGVIVILIAVAGRFFCSWGCPTAFLRRIFGVEHKVSTFDKERGDESKLKKYSGYGVLAAAVVGSFFVGFPLFCLVCPIGLFFGTIFAVHRLFVSYQPGWELLIFPAIIILEIFLFKSWCGRICPVGAFFKLVNKVAGRFINLKADEHTCNYHNGGKGHVCKSTCKEKIYMPQQKKSDSEDCTLCLDCKDKCPNNSIKIVAGKQK